MSVQQKAKVVMVKKNPCPYCDRAQNFFEARSIQVEIIDLTHNLDEIQNWKTRTGWATVPIILINDQLIGGYTDLKTLDEEGRLNALLEQSPEV